MVIWCLKYVILGYLDECEFVYLILCYECIVICLFDSDCGLCSFGFWSGLSFCVLPELA